MLVSVIISTYNNCDELGRSLKALAQCDFPSDFSWEIVVVNNNSTDHTDEVIDSFAEELPITKVFEGRQGLSNGMNAGVAASRGEWLIFTDDDVRPSRSWLQEYATAFRSYPTGHFFGGPIISRFEGDRPPPELFALASAAIRGFSLPYDSPSVCEVTFGGANWAVSMQALSVCGQFNPELGLNASGEMRFGEETDMQQRLIRAGQRPLYLPSASLEHTIPAKKCTEEYILSRAEAFAFTLGREEGFRFGRVLKLVLSTILYYVLFVGSRRKNIRFHHMWRLRRGRLKGHLRASTG